MANAKLRKQSIDGSNLNTRAAAEVAWRSRVNVILTVRHDMRKSPEPVDNIFACARAGKSLQQFLQNQASRQDDFAALKGLA